MRGGFTLVELLMALVVLEVGLLGVVGSLVLAQGIMAEAEGRERMTGEVALLVESLGTGEVGGPGSRRTPWGTVSWSAPRAGRVLVEVNLHRGGTFLVEGSVPGQPAPR